MILSQFWLWLNKKIILCDLLKYWQMQVNVYSKNDLYIDLENPITNLYSV